MLPRLVLCLAATLSTCAALAQTSTNPSTTNAPVSYVYVSRANYIDAFAVSAQGQLTPLPATPTDDTAYHMSVNKKFLFSVDGGSIIHTYAIAPTGALAPVAVTDATKYVSNYCFASGQIQIDESGSTLYTSLADCQQNPFMLSFKIEPTGELQYLGKAPANLWTSSQLRFSQDNKFAFETGCHITETSSGFNTSSATPITVEYKRESNGFLTYFATLDDTPPAKSGESYCPLTMANDPTNHLAFVYLTYFAAGQEFVGPTYPMGVYSVDSEGRLTTTSNYENMPLAEIYPQTMSISPSGKLLAVGGDTGYQFFHFNGSAPPVKWTGPFYTDSTMIEIGWDESNHFFGLTNGGSLIVYNITSTSYKQAAGSPYSIQNPASVIVYNLPHE